MKRSNIKRLLGLLILVISGVAQAQSNFSSKVIGVGVVVAGTHVSSEGPSCVGMTKKQ